MPLTTVLPVVLIVGGIFFNVLVLNLENQQALVDSLYLASAYEPLESDSDSVLADNVFPGQFEIAGSGEEAAGFVIVDGDSVLNASNPLSTILPTRDGLLIYKVQKGDTLSKIAANFGISLNTIFWANNKLSSNIRIGQEIVILPVSGVFHQIEEDETLESVAELYGVPADQIRKYNRSVASGNLKIGTSLVIPGAKPKQTFSSASISNLPAATAGYFIIPTTGWNWGRIHYYNAVDIANACGTPIYAAAEGLVTRSSAFGWNDGYGQVIDIEHPNGATTRYAHLNKNLASVGDYVLQGDIIGQIGNTGNTHGPTGCHLHFEIRGARNPFAK